MDSKNLKSKITSSPLRTASIVVIALLVVGGAAYFLDHSRSAPEAESKGEKKVLYWRSSMDPTEVYKKPGKDSMGMDLVPVYEGEEVAGPPGTVRIDPVTIQNMGVKTAVVELKKLSREIRTIGRVAYDEKKVRKITPKIGGWVEREYVNFAGQVVEKGAPLLEIYSPELIATQEEYLSALRYRQQLTETSRESSVAGAESLLRAAETRLRYWDISDAQINALRERGSISRTMVLHSPFKGIVFEKNALEGSYVQPGQPLYGIADISTVWVQADIYEYEAPWLKLGQEAEMTLAYDPGASYRGQVAYIYPYLKGMTRTLQVRIEFRNSRDFKLKPEMWANVTLKSAVAREGLAVPIQSVIRTGTKDVALVALEGGRFEPRELRLGAQTGDEFEVLDGLRAGERVVTSVQFLINSESNLQSVLSKMLRPKKEEGAPAPPPQSPPMPGQKMPEPPSSKPSPAMPGMEMPASPPGTPSPAMPKSPGKE